MTENGEETYGWRIKALEARVSQVEGKIQNAIYLLIANLVGIIGVLGKLLIFGVK